MTRYTDNGEDRFIVIDLDEPLFNNKIHLLRRNFIKIENSCILFKIIIAEESDNLRFLAQSVYKINDDNYLYIFITDKDKIFLHYFDDKKKILKIALIYRSNKIFKLIC